MADDSPAPVSAPAPLAPASPVRRAPTRLLRVFGASLLVMALAVVGGLLWLPGWLQAQLVRHGSDALGRAVAVERVELHPLALAITLHGLQVAGPPGSGRPPLLSVSRLHADLDLRSLLRLAPVLQSLQIEQPRVQLSRLGDGRWDIDDVLRRLASHDRPAAPEAEPARFALYNVQLLDGQIVVDDQPVKARHTVTGLRIELPFLSNLPDHLQVHVEPRVAFVADGAAFDVRGRSLPFASDRASELTLRLQALELQRFWPYLPAALPWAPSGGVLDAQLTLRFAQPPQEPAQVQLRGRIGLKSFSLQLEQQRPLASWHALEVELLDVQPLRRQIGLGLVRLEGAQIQLDRDASGQLVLSRPTAASAASSPPSPAAPGPSASTAAATWQLQIERTELNDAAVRWRDASVQPAADLGLHGLSLQAGRWVWPLAGDAQLSASAQLRSQARPAGAVQAQARLQGAAGSLQLQLDGLPLAVLGPYVQTVLQPSLDGRLQARTELHWSDADPPALRLDVPQLRVQGLRLQEPQAPSGEPALQVRSVHLDDLRVDVDKRQLRLGGLTLTEPQLLLRRSADGRLNTQQWLRTRAAPTPDAAPATAPDWQLEGRDIKLDGGRIAWQDLAVRPGREPHDVQLQSLQVRLSQLRWPAAGSPMAVRAGGEFATGTGSQRARAGRVELNGQSSLAPLAWRGQLVLDRVASELFEPYVAATLPLRLQHAEFGWRGELQAAQEAGGLRLDARGDAVVTDLDLRSLPREDAAGTAADSQLLAWQALQLRPLVVAVAPGARPRVEVGDLRLADFFARLVVTEQGRFNLSDLQAPPASPGPVALAASATAAAAPAASSAGAATTLPVDLLIGRTELQRGRVDFTDRFVRPNYSAALSDLAGSIGRLASGTREMAPVELRGKVAGTGLLDIRGSINPTASPLALDLQARATDLELAPLSPYSGKYAGYAIERGKLSVDVAYKVDADGRLEARNQIILNQLTFGDKVDSPDATQLPIRFALSLLADRQGVIDIELPITGSINDPQFSVFGIVLKLIGNLIVKAVTAPFTLLLGAGGGDETSVLEFEPGSARPLPAALASLDRVAKALGDRPTLRLTVAGSADASEAEAWRAERLRQALLDELRRERARSGTSATPAVLPADGSPEHLALLRRLYVQTPLPDKPRNVIGLLRELPAAEMALRLRAALPIPADSWRELALQRSLAVRDALVARGLTSDRLFIGAPRLRAEGETAWTPRASLSLGGG